MRKPTTLPTELERFRAMRRDLIERVYSTLKESMEAHDLSSRQMKRWAAHEMKYENISTREGINLMLIRVC